ncbi:MAG: cytidylate kinase-like family protein [Clostridia bacterium]|nr:cytidylate kinase-like family protein [Clostridia bacterium]
MDKRIIITISREYGCGGRIVGKLVAEKLGIPFYDDEIIELTAKKTGLSKTCVREEEQKVKNKFFHNLASGGYYMEGDVVQLHVSLADKVYLTTCEVIRDLAEESCVILGRCADYVLEDREDVVNVFLYANIEKRIEHAVKNYGLSDANARKEMKKKDKYRANHYDYYTDRKWGDRTNYDLYLNTGFLGMEETAEIIVDAVKDHFKLK